MCTQGIESECTQGLIPRYSSERNKPRWTPPKPPGRVAQERPSRDEAGVALCACDPGGGQLGQQLGAEAKDREVKTLPGRSGGFTGYDPGGHTPPPITPSPEKWDRRTCLEYKDMKEFPSRAARCGQASSRAASAGRLHLPTHHLRELVFSVPMGKSDLQGD